MIYFLSESAKHLRRFFVTRSLMVGSFEQYTFSDKERGYRLLEDISRKDTTVVASIYSDPSNFFDAISIFRLLRENRARSVSFIIPFLGYHQQNTSNAAYEVNVGNLTSEIIRNLNPAEIITLEPHSEVNINALGESLNALNADFLISQYFDDERKPIDIIISPDEAGFERAGRLAKYLAGQPEAGHVIRERNTPESAKALDLIGNVSRKNVLIFDDVIRTGSTMIEAIKTVHKAGADSIRVCAVHGNFSNKSHEHILRLPIEELVVTNSLPQPRDKQLNIIDITSTICRL